MQDMSVWMGEIQLQLREHDHPGEAIIFLHFSGAYLMMWQKALPYFQDHYHLLLVDQRGHGKSDAPPNGYHMDELARDVVGLLNHFKLERAHILGSSLGAEVGLSLAANFPDRVLSLVCDGAFSSEFGPFSTWEGSEADFEAHVAHQLEKMRTTPETVYPSLEALLEKSRQSLEGIGWWNADVEAMESYGVIQLEDGKYTKAFRKFARLDYMQHYFHYRLEDYYRRISCPLLLLPGDDVFEHPPEQAAMEGLSHLASRSRVVRVSGWQHPYDWMLDPSGVCRAILEFLAEKS